MKQPIHLSNITVITTERTAKNPQQTKVFEKVPFVDGKEIYKGFKIFKVEKIGILGQTNF